MAKYNYKKMQTERRLQLRVVAACSSLKKRKGMHGSEAAYKVGEQPVIILRASFAHAAAITALVEATAGIIFLTTPCVSRYVTPVISYLIRNAMSHQY